MDPEKVEPLWRTVVGEPEPWRRGRLFLILLGVLTFLVHCLTLGQCLLWGDIERLFVTTVYVLIFWLQYYFIWIGVHWVRWLNGAWSMLVGFVLVIWGWRDQVSVAVLVGIYLLCMGAYLALAPSVYFFAKRQRESVRWLEALVVAAAFLVLLGSIGCGIVGLLAHKASLEQEARQFADTAFRSIFTEHDTYFMLDHASKNLLDTGGGREGLTRFLQATTIQAGDVGDIQPAQGTVRFRYSIPLQLGSEGEMITEGRGDRGRIRLRMVVIETGNDWTIDAIRWSYF